MFKLVHSYFFYTEYVLPLGMLHLNENHLPIEKIFLNKDGGDINKMKYNKIKHTVFFNRQKDFKI